LLKSEDEARRMVGDNVERREGKVVSRSVIGKRRNKEGEADTRIERGEAA